MAVIMLGRKAPQSNQARIKVGFHCRHNKSSKTRSRQACGLLQRGRNSLQRKVKGYVLEVNINTSAQCLTPRLVVYKHCFLKEIRKLCRRAGYNGTWEVKWPLEKLGNTRLSPRGLHAYLVFLNSVVQVTSRVCDRKSVGCRQTSLSFPAETFASREFVRQSPLSNVLIIILNFCRFRFSSKNLKWVAPV